VDRDEIERRDFPAARRGYDAGAVDSHLRRVADEFEALGRAAADRPRAASLSEGTSAQVGAILAAAEGSARQLRAEAERDASGHVARVEAAATDMVDKLHRLQAELDRLLAGLKATAATLDSAPVPAPPPAAAAAANGGARSDDEAGARLVALNMALEGTAREEAARFLAEHYALADVEALLDAVYASAGR